jgi:molybdopterin synthase catalytic subunit
MLIRVRLFAMHRELLGRRELSLDMPEGATIADAWDRLVSENGALARTGASVRFARNGAYAVTDEPLADGDELALIPPVAGGERRVRLSAEPIDDALIASLRREVAGSSDGAVVLFVGQTRDSPGTPAPGQEEEAQRHAAQHVVALEYEAFEELALSTLAAIASEIEDRFGVDGLAVVHRTGLVPVGDPSVAIAAAAPHRAAAFEACRYAIEELKARAPIWKSEHFGNGSVWLGAPARTGPADTTGSSGEGTR